MYPESAAGGFSRHDGTVAFYSRINALLSSDMTVLDLGAGRGAQFEKEESNYRRSLLTLKGRVKELVGADVDPAVMTNQHLDRAVVIDPALPLPFEDETFDIIFSDWVLEHIENPEAFAAEVRRILKPGGWFCARTPNKWGLTAISATVIPERFHQAVLSRLTPDRKEEDVFPKYYRMNTLGHLRRWFGSPKWLNVSYITNGTPNYVRRIPLGPQLVRLYWRLTPSSLHTNIFVFCQKQGI